MLAERDENNTRLNYVVLLLFFFYVYAPPNPPQTDGLIS